MWFGARCWSWSRWELVGFRLCSEDRDNRSTMKKRESNMNPMLCTEVKELMIVVFSEVGKLEGRIILTLEQRLLFSFSFSF